MEICGLGECKHRCCTPPSILDWRCSAIRRWKPRVPNYALNYSIQTQWAVQISGQRVRLCSPWDREAAENIEKCGPRIAREMTTRWNTAVLPVVVDCYWRAVWSCRELSTRERMHEETRARVVSFLPADWFTLAERHRSVVSTAICLFAAYDSAPATNYRIQFPNPSHNFSLSRKTKWLFRVSSATNGFSLQKWTSCRLLFLHRCSFSPHDQIVVGLQQPMNEWTFVSGINS